MPSDHEDAVRIPGPPPIDDDLGNRVEENADDEHGENAAVLLADPDGHSRLENLDETISVACFWPLLDGHVDEAVAQPGVRSQTDSALPRHEVPERGVSVHFPVPLQTGQTTDTLPSPTFPVPRQFSQTFLSGAGDDEPDCMSE